MSNLHRSYTKILSLLHLIEPNDNFFVHRRIPKLSDKQLIALSLAAEAMSIDSERFLFKRLPKPLQGKIERSVYNRRRRKLASKLEQLRQLISTKVDPDNGYHLIDSMPLEICKFSRARRSRICREFEASSPDYGYCAAHNMHYFGYKLHLVCTAKGTPRSAELSRASVHDIHYLEDVRTQLTHCVMVGDKAYLNQQYQRDLFDDTGIRVETPMRRNQINFKPFNSLYSKTRKRIETLFSQLCDQFMMRRNYARSFQGLATRVITKITAFTIIQWINKINGKPINNVKIVPA